MEKQEAFEQLAEEFNLKPTDFYFLDLIPLIEMVWADGKNQPAELDLLYRYAIEHIAYLDRQAGTKVVWISDANDFLDRFALQRPPKKLLKELRNIAALSSTDGKNPRAKTILEYCLDIAAACAEQYPYGMRQRIASQEKALLEKLFREFNIPTDSIAFQ